MFTCMPGPSRTEPEIPVFESFMTQYSYAPQTVRPVWSPEEEQQWVKMPLDYFSIVICEIPKNKWKRSSATWPHKQDKHPSIDFNEQYKDTMKSSELLKMCRILLSKF
jgi:hypothetical protein